MGGGAKANLGKGQEEIRWCYKGVVIQTFFTLETAHGDVVKLCGCYYHGAISCQSLRLGRRRRQGDLFH